MKTESMVVRSMVNDTEHSFERAKERAGLNRKQAKNMMNLARVRGITSTDCKRSRDRIFLENRCDDVVEAVAYNGYCFILERTSKKCITMFALPKNFGKKSVNNYKTCGKNLATNALLLMNWEEIANTI